MFLQVQLKVCEGCGNLWFRAQNQDEVYCAVCSRKLAAFPRPGSRKKRGRPSSRTLTRHTSAQQAMAGQAEAAGGAR